MGSYHSALDVDFPVGPSVCKNVDELKHVEPAAGVSLRRPLPAIRAARTRDGIA